MDTQRIKELCYSLGKLSPGAMGHADTGGQVCLEMLWTFGCRRGGDSFPMTLGDARTPSSLTPAVSRKPKFIP